MRFIAAMAWREVRASWRRLILFFLCIALGVGAMVSLRSFTKVLSSSLSRDARMLMSADVRVETMGAWSPEQIEILTRHASDSRVLGHTRIMQTQTMVRADGQPDARPAMVELRAVEPAFPLRGEVRLVDGTPYSHALLAGRGALVPPGLLERLHLKVGDQLIIGTLPFTVRGAIRRVPGSGLNFGPTPRVLVDYQDVESAGITGFGSRVGYTWLFSVTDGQERAVAGAIVNDYRSRSIRGSINTFNYIENWLTSSLANIDGFLSLIGLSIVVLGGIGIASVTRVFVQQRVKTVAILKCLGGRSRRVLGAYVAQVLALGLGGSLLGLLVAQGITTFTSGFASASLPFDVEPRLSPLACAQGVAVGVLIALLFALPPLLDIRDVKPVLVLRHETRVRRRFDWLKIAAQLLIAGAIAALAGWMAGTYRNASVFAGSIIATVAVLHIAGTILTAGLARLRRLPSFVLRQGIGSLHRPGNQTRVTLFTVGLGSLFVIAVRLMQVNLQQEYALDLKGFAADLFLIDIQPPQRQAAYDALVRLGAADVTLIPMSRPRLTGITRSPANAGRIPANRVGGEYRLPIRMVPDGNESIVSGTPWTTTPATRPEVAVEERYAEWTRLIPGDALAFDVAGRRVEAVVTLIFKEDRRIRSLSSLARSDVVGRPGSFETLPHMFVGSAKGPVEGGGRARLQNEFLVQFPGVTLVDALDDIQEVRKRVADVSRAVSILGGFVLVCGILILVGSVAMTKMHRLYEAAVLKTLGAKRRVLVRITMIEYGVLGLLAGAIGSGASIAVTWGMFMYGRPPVPWHLHPWINLTGAIATAVVVVIVGVLATWDVVVKKPIGVLREQ